MRIATSTAWDTGLDTLSARQVDLQTLQDQITTGKRIGKPSDDPAGAARAERALAAETRAGNSLKAVNASKTAMTQVEGVLGDTTTLLQRARELVVSAGNASRSDSDRASIADELQQIRSQLLQLANQTDGTGNYLFGGQGAGQTPFADTAGGVQYAAQGGARLTEAPTGLPLSADGRAAFMSARSGNGVFVTSAGAMVTGATIDSGRVSDPQALTGDSYQIVFSVSTATPPVTTYSVLQNGNPTAITGAAYTAGRDISFDGMTVAVSGTPADGDSFGVAPSAPTLSMFDTIDRTIAGLRSTGRTGAQVAQANAEALRDIDQVLGTVISARPGAGAVLNRIDSESDRLDGQKLAATSERSNAEDVDLVHAYSEFQTKQTSYDAALKSYAAVQKLSLFEYISG